MSTWLLEEWHNSRVLWYEEIFLDVWKNILTFLLTFLQTLMNVISHLPVTRIALILLGASRVAV